MQHFIIEIQKGSLLIINNIIMRINIKVVLSLACFVATSTLFSSVLSKNNPGITGSIDLSLFDEAKDAYLATVLSSINGLKQFDYDLPKNQGHLYNNTIHISEKPNNVKLFTSDNTTFHLTVEDLSMNFLSHDFKYKLWFIPVKGYAKIKMTDVKLNVAVQLNTRKDKKGRTLMQFDVVTADLILNAKKLDFDLGGGILADFIDFFMPLFRRVIKGDVEKNVESQLKKDLPEALNARLIAENGFFEPFDGIPQFKNLTIDYSVEVEPAIVGSYLGVGINGTVINMG